MKLAKLKALSAEEWQILLSSVLLLPSIALALRFKGFKWTQAFLEKRAPEVKNTSNNNPSDSSEQLLQTAQSVARMVSAAANHGPYRANCLKRSLVTWWLLKRRGIETVLNIGVNRDEGDFNAHAWVEYMGNTLIENDDVKEQFSTFGPQ